MLLAVAVTGRVAQLQITSDGTAIATERRQVLSAARGDLFDRTGQPLAVNDSVSDVYIDAKGVSTGLTAWGPKDVAALRSDLERLRVILGLTSEDLAAKLRADSHWVSLGKSVSASASRQIRDLKQNMVTVVDKPRRVYPDGDIVSGLVGSVNSTNAVSVNGESVADLAGSSGMEKLLNDELTGEPGELLTERGPGNREIPSPNRRLVPAKKGTSFVLSVDRSLQYQADQTLRKALVTYGAVAGYIGVMDVQSGDLLASVGMQIDEKTGLPATKRFNAGVVDTYEPGSTMKPFTMAAALDAGVVTPETRFNVQDHLVMKFRREQKRFKDDTPHKAQYWSVRDILVNSSNVGTITVARKLGPEAVNANLKNFGFGAKTGIGDPKLESAGIMRPVKEWSGVDIGTVPIGQGISVSPVQMLSAMNTLAADGNYVSPRFVTASINADGTRVDRQPQRRRVVSSETAAEVRSMLADVVRFGTGKRAAVDGYQVAGKTGTAQKALKGKYAEHSYMASFAGFFPVDAPKLSILVILDSPFEEYGGLTAAPVFADMVRVTAQRYRIAPQRVDGGAAAASQVLVTPELRAVNDPKRQAAVPVRSIPDSTVVDPNSPTGAPTKPDSSSDRTGATASGSTQRGGTAAGSTVASTDTATVAPSSRPADGRPEPVTTVRPSATSSASSASSAASRSVRSSGARPAPTDGTPDDSAAASTAAPRRATRRSATTVPTDAQRAQAASVPAESDAGSVGVAGNAVTQVGQ